MESEVKLKEIGIKNRMCYYLGDIIRIMDRDDDFDFSNILFDK